MKVGILGHNFTLWGGGVDFLRLVIDSLLSVSSKDNVELFLLIPDAGAAASLREGLRIIKHVGQGLAKGHISIGKVSPTQEMLNHTFSEFQNRIHITHIGWGKPALHKVAKTLDLDVLVPSVFSLGPDFPIPWVGYGYDFQHKYLPDYFSAAEIKKRDRNYQRILTNSKAIIVNAKAVANDIAQFYPYAPAKVFCLPFSAAPNPEWLTEQPNTPQRYGIDAPYFMVSNQFWLHKDYTTLFTAFSDVHRQNKDVILVCTGNTYDPRDPSHFKGLMKKLETAGISPKVKILGMIPKRDQIELMKNAICIVQPTLFEGGPGGGAVFDAISLGVPAILSDIPVNREISHLDVSYFTPGDEKELTQRMLKAYTVKRQRRDTKMLTLEGTLRRQACGKVLLDALHYVLE